MAWSTHRPRTSHAADRSVQYNNLLSCRGHSGTRVHISFPIIFNDKFVVRKIYLATQLTPPAMSLRRLGSLLLLRMPTRNALVRIIIFIPAITTHDNSNSKRSSRSGSNISGPPIHIAQLLTPTHHPRGLFIYYCAACCKYSQTHFSSLGSTPLIMCQMEQNSTEFPENPPYLNLWATATLFWRLRIKVLRTLRRTPGIHPCHPSIHRPSTAAAPRM